MTERSTPAPTAVDRHLEKRGEQTAILWEGDDPTESKRITYRELHEQVSRFANVLKARNVARGDRVTIYMPMIPELAYAVLACARIGAVHSVVFGGFSPDSIAGRILDCASTCVIPADEGVARRKTDPFKGKYRPSAREMPRCRDRRRRQTDWRRHRLGQRAGPSGITKEMEKASADCPPEEMKAEDPPVYPLHLRLDWQTEGRAAYDRRISYLCFNDTPIRLRLPR